MNFTLHLSTRIRDKSHERPLISLMTELALEADSGGFDGISLTEHHLAQNQGYQNSLLFACALAPRVTRAHLVLATINPALHQPLRLVESCNLIDQLTGGRLVVGFGTGFVDTDYIAFGRDPKERSALFERSLATVLEIWTYRHGAAELEFAAAGERGRIATPVAPSSFRQPHPIFARATLTDARIVETAANGWPVMVARWDVDDTKRGLSLYHESLATSGHDAGTVEIARRWTGMTKPVHVAETDAKAEAEADAWFARNPDADPIQRRRHLICGSPETVARELERYADAGLGQMMCAFFLDVENPDTLRRSFGLFRDEVMPRFATKTAALR